MYKVFYIDPEGNYGEANGLLLFDPESLGDDEREKIADLLEDGQGKHIYALLQNIVSTYPDRTEITTVGGVNKKIYQAAYHASLLSSAQKLRVSGLSRRRGVRVTPETDWDSDCPREGEA